MIQGICRLIGNVISGICIQTEEAGRISELQIIEAVNLLMEFETYYCYYCHSSTQRPLSVGNLLYMVRGNPVPHWRWYQWKKKKRHKEMLFKVKPRQIPSVWSNNNLLAENDIGIPSVLKKVYVKIPYTGMGRYIVICAF